MFEVEVKIAVENPEKVRERLRELGEREGKLEQVDVYYQHPCRDFGETDEALRLRRTDGRIVLTYKGPRVGREKSREEVEVEVEDGERMDRILRRLGFRPLERVKVKKRREVYRVRFEGRDVTVALDEVGGLGTFLELECSVGDRSEVERAEESLLRLAERLGVRGERVRESYLELLMERAGE